VSYNEEHYQANGEDNRDDESNNLSWNFGWSRMNSGISGATNG
jgi:pullulanase/glycogen debranching enzyme